MPRVKLAAALLVLGTGLTGQVVDPRWSQPFRLSRPGADPDRAHIVADSKGSCHVLWIEFPSTAEEEQRAVIRYARFDGETWSRPLTVYTARSGFRLGPLSLTIDRNDILHVTWTESDTAYRSGNRPAVAPILYSRVRAEDAAVAEKWFIPRTIKVTAFFSSIQVDFDGKLHLLYSDAFSQSPGVHYASSVDEGETWSDPIGIDSQLPPGSIPYFGVLGLDPYGGLHAVWEYKSGWQTTTILYAQSGDGGRTWSSPTVLDSISSDPAEIQYGHPLLAVQDRIVHVVWAGGGFANVGRRHRYSVDGGKSWSGREQLFGNLHAFITAQALIPDPAGHGVHYMDQFRFPQGLYHAYWEEYKWSEPTLVYLNQKDPADTIGDRIHLDQLNLAAPSTQLVATFTNDLPPIVVYSMHTRKPILYLPFFADGGGSAANVALTNLADKPVKASAKFFDSSGRRLDVATEPRLSRDQWIEIGAYATQVLATTGSSSPQAGYAKLEFDQRAPVSVTAVLQPRPGSEVTLFPLKPGRRFAAFVEKSVTVNTTVAVMRFSDEPVEIALFDSGGVLVASKTWDPGGIQAARMISDLFDMPPVFQGYVLLSSAGDIAPVALRTSDRVLSSVPLVDLDWTPEPANYYFPHYVDGGGWSTTFVSTNYTADAAQGRLMFFDSTGKPQSMAFATGSSAEMTLNLGGNASQVLTTSGLSAPLRSGYAKLETNKKAAGVAIFRWHSGLEACVPAMQAGRRFGLRVERSAAIETAVGLLRLSTAPVRFKIHDAQGRLVQSGVFPLAGSQQARLISEVAALPLDFAGLLILESDGDFAPLALRLGRESLSTAPVVPF